MRLLVLLMLGVGVMYGADLAGRYHLQNVHEVGSELLLQPDGTFEFGLAYGAADYYAKGKWRSEDGFVVLKTDGKKEDPFRLTRSAATKDTGTRVWVLAPNGEPIENIDVAVKTEKGFVTARTSGKGDASFPEVRGARAAVIRLAVCQIEAGPFELNPAYTDFYFEINADAITRVDFDNERMELEGGAIVMRHWGADHPMRYTKQ